MLIVPPFFTEVTFIGYLVMKSLFDLHPIIQPLDLVKPDLTEVTFIRYLVMRRLFDLHPIIQPLDLVKPDLILPLNHPHLTILTSKTPLGPFKMSKFPSESLLLLKTLLFRTLSKSAIMSFMGCLPPRHNISKTIGPV